MLQQLCEGVLTVLTFVALTFALCWTNKKKNDLKRKG